MFMRRNLQVTLSTLRRSGASGNSRYSSMRRISPSTTISTPSSKLSNVTIRTGVRSPTPTSRNYRRSNVSAMRSWRTYNKTRAACSRSRRSRRSGPSMRTITVIRSAVATINPNLRNYPKSSRRV